MKKLLALLTLFTLQFLGLSSAFAQTNPLYIEQYPKQLKAEETVYFTLKATEDFSLAEVNIVWKVDGTKYDEGVGRTTFKTTVPKQNKERKVTAEVEIPGQVSVFVSIPLRATPYLFLYEGADSVTPTFYKGRKLPGKEGYVRVGVVSTVGGFSSQFKVNGTTYNSANNVAIIPSRITEKSLDIQTNILQNGDVISILNKTVNLLNPEVQIFATDKDQTLQAPVSGSVSGSEAYLRIDPYFYSAKNIYDSKLSYVWRLNGEVRDVKEPWFVRLASTNKENIQANIEVKQSEKITQRAEKVFNLIFN
jgi:hypothetical protein